MRCARTFYFIFADMRHTGNRTSGMEVKDHATGRVTSLVSVLIKIWFPQNRHLFTSVLSSCMWHWVELNSLHQGQLWEYVEGHFTENAKNIGKKQFLVLTYDYTGLHVKNSMGFYTFSYRFWCPKIEKNIYNIPSHQVF